MQAVGLSVVFASLYHSSRGSTLLAVLVHGAVNAWYTAAVQGLSPLTPVAGRRVANLSDAVFAIAMTLLVLTLDTPTVATGALGGALGDQTPQPIAFVLAFALVANLWWQHHKLMALFQFVEPGMVGIVLALLGAVALVPYPTSMVGNTPGDRAAGLAFIAVFVVLSLLYLLLVVRTRRAAAFRDVVSDRHYYMMLGQWSAGIVVLLVAALLTLWLPTVGLSVLALTIILGPIAARRGASGRHRLINRHLPDE